MKFPHMALAAACALALSACAGQRAFTQGEYGDPEEISMLDDKWNQNDMQLIAKKMLGSMESWIEREGLAEKPKVVLGMPKNRTSEHIDMQALYDHIKTNLIQSGSFSFLDKDSRQEIAEEGDYQNESGYVDPDEAVRLGRQKGAGYLLDGVVTSTVQQVGKNKAVYYKATFELTDIETTEIVWTDHKEIVKHFRKKSIGL